MTRPTARSRTATTTASPASASNETATENCPGGSSPAITYQLSLFGRLRVTTPQGWYPDPQVPGTLRYWDGRHWTSQTAPQGPAAAPPVREHAVGARQDNISFFGAKKRAEQLQRENHEQRALLERLGALELVEVEAEVGRVRAALDQLRAEESQLEQQIRSERQHLVEVQGELQLQDVGLYRYHHPAESSVALRAELEQVQSQIKDCVRAKSAILANTNFFFNNSAAQGRKFVNEMSRIMLRAYNAEPENCVKTVKAGNLAAAQARLLKAKDQIEKQGRMIDLRVADHYHALRLRELELAADFHMRVQEEKEAEREARAELREQRKAEQELRAERERLEKLLQKEQAHYANFKAMLEANGDEEGIRRLEQKLADVQRAIDDIDYRAANIRAGFVYVISNVGAFGRNMVKIGLTRRLEPLDRIRELGDASVPFRFDVHTLFFADDAVTVETKLHQAFAEKRVNKINLRREFFYATPEEVLEVLKSTVGEVVQYTAQPEAEEYRLSLGKPDVAL
jgi:Meiotically up-regulated gene 113/Domain of unknown function (DUF4041)/Protein of unknown function (DUF2510)